jgi:uroporphyrinogen decarboxylase
MNRREIFKRTMNHEEAGRVLVDQGKQVTSIHRLAYPAIRKVMGLPEKQGRILDRMSQCVWSDEDLLEAWNIDFRWIVPNWVQIQEIDKDNYRNMFGTLFTNSGSYFAIADAPLKELSLDEIKEYHWPETNDPRIVEGLAEQARSLYENTDYVIGADGIKGGILQTALELRGYDQFFMDLALEPDLAHYLLDKLTELYKGFYSTYLPSVAKYCQLLYLTDDFGTQNSLLMSPDMWREFILPRQQELIRHIRSLADLKIMFHTDGSVLPLIDDMIDMGVDILNPVQTSVEELRDTAALKSRYGDRICFHGAMDVQNVLINSTPDQVRMEVKKRLRDLGTNGGFMIATCHNINTDIPPENLKVMFEAIQQYGSYPLKF